MRGGKGGREECYSRCLHPLETDGWFDKVVAKSGQNATRCRIDSSAMREEEEEEAEEGAEEEEEGKKGRKEGIRVVGQSGPATSSSCPGLEGGGEGEETRGD